MNVFELIKEKLDKRITETYNEFVEGNRDAGVRCNAYHNAKDIVDEVAQEYAKTPTPTHPIPIDTQQYIEELEKQIREARNKDIEEFAERLSQKIKYEIDDCADELDWIDEIAEQLKGGSDD